MSNAVTAYYSKKTGARVTAKFGERNPNYVEKFIFVEGTVDAQFLDRGHSIPKTLEKARAADEARKAAAAKAAAEAAEKVAKKAAKKVPAKKKAAKKDTPLAAAKKVLKKAQAKVKKTGKVLKKAIAAEKAGAKKTVKKTDSTTLASLASKHGGTILKRAPAKKASKK